MTTTQPTNEGPDQTTTPSEAVIDARGAAITDAVLVEGALQRVPAPDLEDFQVHVPRWRLLLDHVGLTGEDVKRRWRLNAEMANFVTEQTAPDGTMDARIVRLLAQAKRVEDRDVDSGWTAFNAARRHGIGDLPEPALLDEATHVAAAASRKLTGWRQEAATLLLHGVASTPPHVTHSQVVAVAHLLDEHHDNRYRQLAVHARSLRFLGVCVIALLAVFGVIVVNGVIPPMAVGALGSAGSYIAVIALGGMGALLSVFTSRIGGPEANPIADMAKRSTGYVRPLLGALSAVVVVLVLESGVQSVVNLTGNAIYLGAVLAGFSERFLSRTLDGLASG